jgi:aldehyde dehydrogenase (NAD+)
VAWATPEQVESAIGTASTAFQTWGLSSKQERIDLLDAIDAGLTARQEELGETISKALSDKMSLSRARRFRSVAV